MSLQERRQKENDELESIHDKRRQIATEAEHLQLAQSKLFKTIDARVSELENQVGYIASKTYSQYYRVVLHAGY